MATKKASTKKTATTKATKTKSAAKKAKDQHLLQMGGVVIIKGGSVNVISEDNKQKERPFNASHGWNRNRGEHIFTRNSQITAIVLRYQRADGTYYDSELPIPHEVRVSYDRISYDR